MTDIMYELPRTKSVFSFQANLSVLQVPVSSALAESIARRIGAVGYFETSTKESQGVTELFQWAARLAFMVLNTNIAKPKAQRTRGLSSAYQSNLFRSYHKFLHKS